MRLARIISLLIILVYSGSSCVQEFDPPRQGYENLLVIEAFLSDVQENFKVTLSRSVPLDSNAFIPEAGARISLIGESGERFDLVEISPGNYESQTIINPEVGKSYQLSINTRSGNTYESEMVTMRETPPVKDVSYAYQEKPLQGIVGIQIFVDTEDPNNNTWFYRWEYDETWKFRVPYDADLIIEDFVIKPRGEDVQTCWRDNPSTNIKVSTSRNLSQDKIDNFPLVFVSNETDRLTMRYSINVKQFSLSEEAYNYWLELEKVTENLGTLFDPQPSIVRGNYRNTQNDNEVVIGYFDAAEVQQKRIYINRAELPNFRRSNFYSYCQDTIVSPGRVGEILSIGWVIVREEIVQETGLPGYLFSYQSCIDCRQYGTNVKPEFWVE